MKYTKLFITLSIIILFQTAYAQIIDLQKLTDSHTRVVWIRDFKDKQKLIGFDSKNNAEHIIFDKFDTYKKPLFTPDGKRIVFSSETDKYIYVVDWNGDNLRKVIKGNIAEVWQDPDNNTVWLYYQTEDNPKSPLYRTKLDEKSKSELIWNSTKLQIDNFQLSRDGKFASGLFPWPKGGIANLETKNWKLLGNGCWTSLAPDNSKLFWIFDGSHRNVFITCINGRRWLVPIGNAEGINGFEVYHPRWSNSPEIIAISGPYVGRGGKPGGNRIHESYKAVEIYVGKFSKDYRTIEAWSKITDNEVKDYFPDVWVKDGEKVDIPSEIANGKGIIKNIKTLDIKTINTSNKWPPTNKGLVFIWDNAKAENKVKDYDEKIYSAQLKLRGKAIYGCYNDLDLVDGWAEIEGANDNLLHSCKNTNQLTLEAYITSSKDKQTGPARIISFSTNSTSRDFTLGQEDNKLVLRLRTPSSGINGSNPEIELCTITPNRAIHIIISYAEGQTNCFVNGKSIPIAENYIGNFSNWEKQKLIFGDEWNGNRNWSGKLEGVAIYNRFFSDKEAAIHYELWQKKVSDRKQIETIVVNATLEQISQTPSPASIAPYRRCLAEYIYKINSIEKGTLKSKRIIVAHWVILDGKKIEVPSKIGQTKRLVIQAFNAHKELEGERLVSDLDEFDLERFVDMNR